ncbi:hypothetical protein PGB90_001032 [Kerria lacca]
MISEEIFYKFHSNHGAHIILEEHNSVAHRTFSFDDGLVFSEKHLQPGEFFVIEVEQNDDNWIGYLRLGLTQINPNIFSSKNIKIPKRAVPDLMELGITWVYNLSDLLPNITDSREISWPFNIEENKFDITEEYIKTCQGTYSRFNLKSLHNNDKIQKNHRLFEINTGFKIGVVYVPTNDTISELFYIINGDVLGPYAVGIPYNESPLYGVVDIFGKTKRIRVLQIQAEKSLKQMCRLIILKTHDMEKIKKSLLPKSIIDYLNFKSDII